MPARPRRRVPEKVLPDTGFTARGSESVAIADATGRPNLAVTGSVSDVDLEFVLLEAEPVEVPVELSFGMGL